MGLPSSTFDSYSSGLQGLLSQNGVSYLYNSAFVQAYVQDPNFRYTDVCYQDYGFSPSQIDNYSAWFWGVLQTTIANMNLP